MTEYGEESTHSMGWFYTFHRFRLQTYFHHCLRSLPAV